MLSNDFDQIVDSRVRKIVSTLASKGEEYASEDRLYNFKCAASITNTSPEQALLGMLSKHLVSVLDLISGKLENTGAMVNEKIGDSINYLILLEALLTERRASNTIKPEVVSAPFIIKN